MEVANDTVPNATRSLVALRPHVLSHHHAGQEERCLLIGRTHICRRCVVLYPIAFAVLFFSVGGLHWPVGWDRVLLLLLPAPMAADYVLEQLEFTAFSARRQMLCTAMAAPALGRGFARYLSMPDDPSLHWMVFGFGGACLVAFAIGNRRRTVRREAAFRAEMAWADVDFDDDGAVAATLAQLRPIDPTPLG